MMNFTPRLLLRSDLNGVSYGIRINFDKELSLNMLGSLFLDGVYTECQSTADAVSTLFAKYNKSPVKDSHTG